MLAGQPPFSEGGLGERILKHLQEEPPDIRKINAHVSEEMWALLQRMLAKQPEERFQTPAELLRAKALPPQASDGEPVRLQRKKSPSSPPPSPAANSSDSSPVVAPDELPETKEIVPRPRARQIEDDPTLLGLSAEHLQAAARQYQRAEEARRQREHGLCRAAAVELHQIRPGEHRLPAGAAEIRQMAGQRKRRHGWLASLTTLTTRARINAAKKIRQFRKVIEEGEAVLVRDPSDLKTQMAMAESAEELGLTHLASWMLEELRRQDPKYLPAHRALATIYEKRRQFSDAIAVWELVRKVAPHDGEAARKIQDLAANDAIARGNYRR